MAHKRTPSSRTRNRISFTKIPLWGIGLIVGVLLLSWAYDAFVPKPGPADNTPALKAQAIVLAQQAVREKVGDSLSVTFPTAPEVEAEKQVFTVRSLFVAPDRRGEQHKRPWMVTLEFKGGAASEAGNWKVLSLDIGQ